MLSVIDGSDIWLMVDGDNDGIEDIFMCDYLGGSGGPVYYHFFKGNSEGGYEHTDEYSIFKEEFGFLSFEGQNYLAQTTWDFGKKVYDGIRLTCYLEGIFQGGVVLKIVPKQGEEIESFKIDYLKEEKLQALVEGLQKFSDNYVINREVLAGSAEQVNEDEKYNRAGDIDNDGIKEQYHLFMGYTTNYYTVDGMVFKAQEEELADTVYNLISGEIGNFMGMWVDETEFGNVTYLLHEEGLYDFYISGYLFSRENDRWESQKLIQVTCKVQTEVVEEPYNPYVTE